MNHQNALNFLALAGCVTLVGCDHVDSAPERSPTTVDDQPQVVPSAPVPEGVLRQKTPGPAEQVAVSKQEAEADLKAVDGSKLQGEIELKAVENGVLFEAKIEGATPGKHGLHIHEKGDCSNIPAKSMGDHFNPDGKNHMLPTEGNERHLGDLGNIEVGEDGKGTFTTTLMTASLNEGHTHSLLGKSVVIHASEDLGQTKQPAGDSGQPIACGVIEKD